MITTISKRLLLLTAFIVAAFQHLAAQDSKCPPIVIPLFTYQYQQPLKSGFGAEVNFWFPPGDCCDLCYLWGPTAAVKLQYFPEVKTVDMSASFGYRVLFVKAEITGGYAIADKSYGKNFFHLDPGVALDLAAANISVGYSFRSAKLDKKVGGMFVRIAVSPLIFLNKSKPRTLFSAYSKATKAEIKAIKAKL
jgi:hypothetical protein